MVLNRFIKMNLRSNAILVTSPSGSWKFPQLIGASVRIRSRSIGKGFFGFDSEQVFSIKDIKFRMSQLGKSITVVSLNEIDGEFVWKDLEIVSLRMPVYGKAICGTFCCGESLCGFDVMNDEEQPEEENSNNNSNQCCSCIENGIDGDVLD